VARDSKTNTSPFLFRLFVQGIPLLAAVDARRFLNLLAVGGEVPVTGEQVSMLSDAPSVKFQKWN
jgi:hypothetical protein